jgi:hypothetical protein
MFRWLDCGSNKIFTGLEKYPNSSKLRVENQSKFMVLIAPFFFP